ncbi:phage tail protein [Mammaliicoccus sciuri]|uniref:phage tail protein n=1 Tax=Mammaliicoccus sciuri TaxID=1296 RepID=UPI00195337DA|nr:terminase [Mammaliicoccus sciuri]
MDKHFMAKIMANINNFQRNVKKAQALAKTSIPDEIETDITANTSKFQRGLMRAKAMAQKWRSHDVEFKADTSQLMAKYGATKLSVEKWKEHTVDINANTSRFMRAIKGAKKSLIDLNKHEYRPNLGWVDKETNKLVKSTKYVEGRFTGMFSTIKRGWAQTQKAQDEFDRTMMSMAQSIRSFGTVFSNQIKGTLIASFQGLIPIIAGLVPAIMAVGNALKVVTGGALALAGAVAIAAGGFVGFGAMAFTAINLVGDGTLKATKETRRYESALQGVKDAWVDIVSDNYTKVFSAMANGMNAVKVALKGIAPFLAGVAEGMDKASESLLQWTKSSSVAKAFFNMMETTGVSVFNKMLSAAGKFGDGLIDVFTQLAPLFQWSANWLDRIATNFSKWANSASGQNSIKQFMEYTKQNLPLIGKIFGNTFAAINNLMKAFGSNSTNIFEALAEMTQKFRDWSETVGKSEGFKKFIDYVQQNGPKIMDLIGNLTMLLVNFGTAMAPIASKILDVVNAIISFTSNLFEAHPGVAKLVGIMTILGGILLAVVPTIAQVAIFVKDLLIPFISWASKAGIVSKVMGVLKGVLGKLASPLTLLRTAFGAIVGALGAISAPVWIVIGVITALIGVITYLWKTNEDFRNAVTNAWNTIKDKVSEAITGVIDWFKQLWSSIQTTLQPIMPLLQQIGGVVSEVLGATFVGAIQLLMLVFNQLWTVTQVVWQAIGGIIMAAVQLITGIFTAFMQLLSGDFSGAWLTLQTTISTVMDTIWSTIQSIWTTISEFFFSIYNTILGTTISSWSEMWSFISGKLQAIWNSVTSYFNLVLSTIISTMSSVLSTIISTWNSIVNNIANYLSNAVNTVINGMSNMLSSVVNGMVNIVNAAINGMVNFVGAVRDGLSQAVNAALSFVGDFISAGTDLIMGMVQGVKNAAGALVDAAVSTVQNAVSAAKSALKINSPSKVFAEIGMWSVMGMVKGIEGHRGSAISSTERLANSISNAFNPQLVPSVDSSLMRDGISSAVGNIDGYIDSDVRHSIAENSKPVVNLHVHNESDLPAIKSWIDDASSKENNTFNF